MEWLPIAISCASLILACVALGWNIYRDVVLKARVRVSLAVVRMVSRGSSPQVGDRYVRINATNYGPGPVKIDLIVAQGASFRQRLTRRPQHFVILTDAENVLSGTLPHRLQVGETLTLLLPYNRKSFLGSEATRVGVADSFGRSHFAPTRDWRTAKVQFLADYEDLAE